MIKFTKRVIKGECSIHFLAITWFIGTTIISFIFEKFPATNPMLRMNTVLYLLVTSRFLQSLLSVLILLGMFRILKRDVTKVGILYLGIIIVTLSLCIATFTDALGYIFSGDCGASYWCMRTYFSK